ncbi:MAG: C2H2-type zinc finger protein [Candidatus Nanohaloarchaea archaeon]|nr:C2H2-type zinc finger protein [Candidatus Nanohaloarchaea archaeon]
MPRYVCDECGDVFDSKEALQEHGHEDDGQRFRLPELRVPDLTVKQLAVLGGVVLMSTLFLGTVFFASSLAPSSPSSGGNTRAREPSPPVGYTVRSQSDIPNVDSSRLPSSPVVDRQLSQDVQLYLLTRPAVLLQYSCTGCPETVDRLRSIAQDFNGAQTWVYVAPYRDMEARIAATGFRQGPRRFDTVDRGSIEAFICTALRDRPVRCAVR